jgi:hypothetical protein
MKDEDLRDFFAGLAMVACIGNEGDYDSDAQACYKAADAMIRAKYANPEPEEGITAIKPKRKRSVDVPTPDDDTRRN